MDKRYYGEDAGSSRSARDDSRKAYQAERSDGRREHGRERPAKSRSRSPRRRYSPGPRRSPERRERYRDRSPHERSSRFDDDGRSRRSLKRYSDEDEVPAPPPPPRITKISIELAKPALKVGPIKMSLSGPSRAAPKAAPKPTVASVFNDDDEEEPEEMPAEARMRMRNIGRETPTSAGPNSFGKTKQGFCDSKKIFEKNMKQAMETEEGPKQMGKFPQTIYKLKGP